MSFGNYDKTIDEMLDELFENLDMGPVCRSSIERAAAMIDQERERRNMTKEERDKEIQNAYGIDYGFTARVFPPVNDLRSDSDIEREENSFQEVGYLFTDESTREGFRKRLRFDVDKYRDNLDTKQKNIQQEDSQQAVDSGGRSYGEE